PESASVTVTAPAALGISTPANSTITLPNTTFYASYALTNGTGANTDCYLLDYNSAVLKTDLTCASPMSYNTPASSGSYGYFMRAVKSSTNETKTSGMFTVTVTNAAAGLPTVTSPTSASITSTSATLGGNITSNGGSALTERGVCWSVSPSTNASDGCNLATGTSTGVFTKDVTGLTSGRLHYYKAFARNSAGYGYSPISSFTTSGSSSLPDLIASAFTGPSTVPVDAAQNYISTVTNIGNARAGIPDSYAFQNLWQKATAWNGGGQVSDWGYSSMGALDPGDSADSSLWITFTSPGNYSIRTCADKNSSGNPGTISESDESENSNCGAWKNVTVTSAPTVPSVTTSAVSNITQTTATGGGNVTSNGGATVTVSGLVWSTSNNPTYNGGGPVSGSTGQTTDGWAIGGPWSSSMTGLSPNTTYHVRAYAVNSVGTAYGFNVQFITSAVSTYYDLRVTKNGAGADTGTVFSNIGGINCGSTCSDDYVSGSSVTLGASVTGGGTFAGWSGAGCSGTGACTILMNSAKNVKATFTAAPCANRATNPPACTTGGGGNCLNGATNPPICTTGGGTMSGTLIPSRASCTIASGASSCTINFSWSVTNPAVIGGTAVTSDINNSGASSPNFSIAPPVSSGTADNGTKTNVMIPYNSRTFYLYNNGIEPPLAVSNVFSSCVTDTEWNGTVCLAVPPPPPPSPPICGDGDVDSGEQCDDGENNGNYCPSTCNTSCEIVSPCRKRPIFIDD
ncbi:hypothetical protein HYZ82_01695, partial [Candidatus Nomurabacteria bacterium]|nr:hypothetical protein [Candidatus Nomurabacteria bacterium]